MPSAVLVSVADAVVSALNGGTWSQTFTAARTYEPEYELKVTGTLQVPVVPAALKMTRGDRGRNFWTYEVRVGVFQRPDPYTQEALDALVLLVEQIGDYFAHPGFRLTSPAADCVSVELDPVYSDHHLYEFRQFSAVLALTFRLLR